MALSPDAAFDFLRRAHEQNRLGHAYLISGNPRSGKRTLASRIARLVNDETSEDIFASSSGAVLVAEPESKSRRIVIEQIRELEHSLQLRAADGRKKIAVISEADRMVPQAANAFLKTLEEPPKDSLLLLLSALPELLPDTVLSRCISIPLTAPPRAEPLPEEIELIELLTSAARTSQRDVQTAYRLAQGFQRLLAGIKEKIQAESAASLKAEEARYQNRTDGGWLDTREDHYKALNESMYLRRRAELVETLVLWWGEILRAKAGIARSELATARAETTQVAQSLTTSEILRRLRRVEELRDQLGRNIQEALAIEVAFLSLFAA